MNSRHRSKLENTLKIGLFAVLLLVAVLPAAAMERGSYSMEILVDGRPLQEFAGRNRTYVEALEGREYSIRLQNHTDRRIAVALSVDGLNSIDAKTTSARDARKWILAPRQTITLDGWQTSSSTARRFFFTTETDSYGAWLGKTRNLGLITAAVFRERPIRPRPLAIDAPAAPGEKRRARADASAEADDDHAATGIGRELDHRVRRVNFVAEASPAAVLELRYEYHDALVRLGVLPRTYARHHDPLDRRERARGFDDLDFAPDPYRR